VSEIASINIVNSNRKLYILGALKWYVNKDLVSQCKRKETSTASQST